MDRQQREAVSNVDISQISEWDPADLVDHATVIVTARRRSGKSFALKRIIQANRKRYDEMYVFSGTIDCPVNKKEYGFIPKENMYNHLDEEVIRGLLNKQMEMLEFNSVRPKKEHIRSNVCIILDDILTDSTFRKANNIVSELFVQGRHSHISLFVLVQSFSGREGIPPLLRKNADLIISFYLHSFQDIKSMAEQFLSQVDVKSGMAFFKAVTNEAHTACIVDVNNTAARNYHEYVYKYLAPEKCPPFYIGDKPKKGCAGIKAPKQDKPQKGRLSVNRATMITRTVPRSQVKSNIIIRTLDNTTHYDTVNPVPAYEL